MKEPFIIETDHKNLTYWKSPKKLSGRTARWYKKLQNYNFRILHIPGKANMPADALSRPNGPEATEPAKEVALIPPAAFLNVFGLDSVDSVESRIVESQQHHQRTLKQWAKMLPIQEGGGMWKDTQGDRLIIPPDEQVKCKILWVWHDHLGGGHRGRDEMARQICSHYYWPRARPWIEEYIKGCAIC
jgi:hypothetical protein